MARVGGRIFVYSWLGNFKKPLKTPTHKVEDNIEMILEEGL